MVDRDGCFFRDQSFERKAFPFLIWKKLKDLFLFKNQLFGSDKLLFPRQTFFINYLKFRRLLRADNIGKELQPQNSPIFAPMVKSTLNSNI